MNLQKVAGGKKFLELLLEVVNFTGYRLIRRTLGKIDFSYYYLLYGKLREWAVCGEYGSTKIIFSVLFMPYNKSFIDQASLVKMAGYWPSSLFVFLYTETKS